MVIATVATNVIFGRMTDPKTTFASKPPSIFKILQTRISISFLFLHSYINKVSNRIKTWKMKYEKL